MATISTTGVFNRSTEKPRSKSTGANTTPNSPFSIMIDGNDARVNIYNINLGSDRSVHDHRNYGTFERGTGNYTSFIRDPRIVPNDNGRVTTPGGKIPRNEFYSPDIANDFRVMKPWKPIVTDDSHRAYLYNRSVRFRNVFFDSLQSYGHELLASGIQMYATTNIGVKRITGTNTLDKDSQNVATRGADYTGASKTYRGSCDVDGFNMSWVNRLEYDGMCRHDITLTPLSSGNGTAFGFRKEQYLHYPYSAQSTAWPGLNFPSGDNLVIASGNNSFAVEFNYRLRTLTPNDAEYIIHHSNQVNGGSRDQHWVIRYHNASQRFVFNVSPVGSGTVISSVLGNTVPTVNSWNHVVCQYIANSGLEIWQNGVRSFQPYTSGVTYSPVSNASYPYALQIGALAAYTLIGSACSGDLDYVRGWKNRALTSDEILALYNNGATQSFDQLSPSLKTNMRFAFEFDGGNITDGRSDFFKDRIYGVSLNTGLFLNGNLGANSVSRAPMVGGVAGNTSLTNLSIQIPFKPNAPQFLASARPVSETSSSSAWARNGGDAYVDWPANNVWVSGFLNHVGISLETGNRHVSFDVVMESAKNQRVNTTNGNNYINKNNGMMVINLVDSPILASEISGTLNYTILTEVGPAKEPPVDRRDYKWGSSTDTQLAAIAFDKSNPVLRNRFISSSIAGGNDTLNHLDRQFTLLPAHENYWMNLRANKYQDNPWAYNNVMGYSSIHITSVPISGAGYFDVNSPDREALGFADNKFMRPGAGQFYQSPSGYVRWLDGSRYSISGIQLDHPDWKPFLLNRIENAFRKNYVGGVYLDDDNPFRTTWGTLTDNLGVSRTYMPVLAQRDIMRGIYSLSQQYGKILIAHPQGQTVSVIHGFTHLGTPGEQLGASNVAGVDVEYYHRMPMEAWRTIFSTAKHGIAMHMLPQYGSSETAVAYPTEYLLGLLTLHDINIYGNFINSAAFDSYWRALNTFDMTQVTAFSGYWQTQPFTYTQSNGYKISSFEKANQNELLLCVVMSTGVSESFGTTIQFQRPVASITGLFIATGAGQVGRVGSYGGGAPFQNDESTYSVTVASGNFGLYHVKF